MVTTMMLYMYINSRFCLD